MTSPAFLYIEDTASSREVMRLLLCEMMAYTDLTMLSDSADVLNKLQHMNKHFDVIFLDINIEPIDGYAICQALRGQAAYDNTHIIAVTAAINPSALERMRSIGFNGAISKPLDMETFPTQINSILAGNDLWDAM